MKWKGNKEGRKGMKKWKGSKGKNRKGDLYGDL